MLYAAIIEYFMFFLFKIQGESLEKPRSGESLGKISAPILPDLQNGPPKRPVCSIDPPRKRLCPCRTVFSLILLLIGLKMSFNRIVMRYDIPIGQ